MTTYVNEILPTNVRVVGESASDEEVATPPTLFLEADWQGQVVKGLQVGSTVIWFDPGENASLAEFFGEEK